MSEERVRELEKAVSDQMNENRRLRLELSAQKQTMEVLETQKTLAQKELELNQLKENSSGGAKDDDGKVKALELERKDAEIEAKDATIEALKARHKLVMREMKECKQKLAASGAMEADEEGEKEDAVQIAVDIGQRKHVTLKGGNRLCLAMWKAPYQLHAVHFNHFQPFVKACSSVVMEFDDEDDDEWRSARKRRRPENKEWIGLLELDAPFVFDEVAPVLKRLGENDLLFGPVFLQSEMQVWKKGKNGAYQTGRMPVRLSTLRRISVDDNFMRQSRQIIADFIISQRDRHFSSDDSWLYLSKVMD